MENGEKVQQILPRSPFFAAKQTRVLFVTLFENCRYAYYRFWGQTLMALK